MEEKLKKQAIDLFVAQYGITPRDKGFPVIDVCQEKKEFLFARNSEVIEARLTELKLMSFFDKAYLMPLFIIVMDVVLAVFMYAFPQFMPYISDGVWFLTYLLLCVGCVLFYKGRKLKKAREKSQDGLIEIFY